jgi:hypothetical protein
MEFTYIHRQEGCKMTQDARIVGELEAVVRSVEQAAARDGTPERRSVLASLQVMLQQPLHAARLLAEEDRSTGLA